MIGSLIALLFILALFSATEAAVSALGREWLEEEGRRGVGWARALSRLGESPAAFQRVALVGHAILVTALAGLWIVWIYRHAPQPPRAGWLAAALAAAAAVILLVGLLGPRLLALRYPRAVARGGLLPFAAFFSLFWGISTLLGWLLDPLVHLVARGRSEASPAVTEEEIKRVISEGSEAGVLAEEEREMLYSVIEFNDTMAREVMVPRLDMVALETGASPTEILRVALEEGYSRVPVYKGTLDNIVGIVHVKDLLRVWEHRDLIVLHDIMRKPHFIPETKKLSELLREFRTKHIQMAIVVDEFGSTEGLVTLEDVLEEIVGEIRDEHDLEEPQLRRVGEQEFVVDARMNLEDFGEALELTIPESDVDTVGGFVIELFGHIPRQGERAIYGHHSFEALQVDKSRVLQVRVSRAAEGDAPPSGEKTPQPSVHQMRTDDKGADPGKTRAAGPWT